ncbi:class I SAM-dependent methyltransferase [Hyphomicrobium sp.]|uniref:class I SAM-dependent methyltransferase n=1 Tax=Hyphomicrobium sp. TaxID=82 RepID=UPI0025C17923|nr:class I SAM-dependent methyltransferase [Hyphomicrobium sp.]MCC7251592.1 class I SAM-dependent methyltransferase [Hyphomicrobium sp.]
MTSDIRSHARPTCEVCLQSGATVVHKYTRSRWPVVACNACGFVYLGEVPAYEDLSVNLAWEKQHAEEKARRKRTNRHARLDALTRFRLKLGKLVDRARHARSVPDMGRVLEIGCGGSTRIPEGPTPYGIEISEGLSRKARPIFEARGGAVYHEPATTGIERFPEDFFDSIIMRSYLEHEAQPRLILERAFKRLKPGGTILLRSPNYNSANRYIMGSTWCGFRFPDHVNYFTPRSLCTLAESIGYEFRWKNWMSLFDDNLIVELRRPERERAQARPGLVAAVVP